MATTINTIEDLMKVLDSHPEWLEAMRSRLLTRELLALPQTFAEFVETTNRRFDGVDDPLDRTNRRFDQIDRRFDQIDRRLERLEDMTGILVGAFAREEAIKEIVLLPGEMGMATRRRLLGLEDLQALIRSADTAGIPADDLRSFRRTDTIVEAEDQEGRTCYIAAELSSTVNRSDTSRAIRNAGFMTRFTGDQAYPAVMGFRVDEQVLDVVESGEVHWYRLDPMILDVR